VLSLASFDASSATMSWIGIGNVEGVLLRRPGAIDDKRERLLVWGGVVGHTMPSARAATLSVAPGDVLAFATDGIASSFADDLHAGEDVDQAAARVLAKHSTTKDDALVLVARYRGAAP
jgi:serine phosphatase RsbU (regulator of sigma subunit)